MFFLKIRRKIMSMLGNGAFLFFSISFLNFLLFIINLDEIQNEINSIYEFCTVIAQNFNKEPCFLTLILKFRKLIIQTLSFFLDSDFQNVQETIFFEIYQKIFLYFKEEKHKLRKINKPLIFYF